jgi:glycosyltransferase involved in cell wall biosynthesis
MGLEMKVLQLTMHDNSGAGKAALRLHHSLMNNQVNSTVLVSQRLTDIPNVKLPEKNSRILKFIESTSITKLLERRGVEEDNTFSINLMPSFLDADIRNIAPALINLHWVGWEFLQIEYFKRINVPIVWTLHDMWAFTGGCHYSGDCDHYIDKCGNCPQLNSTKDQDLSRWVWQRKVNAWKNLNLTIVTPSRWLARCAQASSLCQSMRIEVIPNGLNVQKYKPIDKQQARNLLGLPLNVRIILFGAVGATSAPRKGFKFLEQALHKLGQHSTIDQIELVVFGSSQPSNSPDLGFKVNYLGRLSDDITLALVYAAADVFVAPSIEDNLPNTVMESLACGTPCVSFQIGGMSDLIEHKQNGYLAKPFDVDDLAQGIAWVLADSERHQRLCDRSRAKVEHEFDSNLQAQRYTALYQELINRA